MKPQKFTNHLNQSIINITSQFLPFSLHIGTVNHKILVVQSITIINQVSTILLWFSFQPWWSEWLIH